MTIQSNENSGTNSQIRIPPDIELASDVRRSIAKIFTKILVNEGKQNPNNETSLQEIEPGKND